LELGFRELLQIIVNDFAFEVEEPPLPVDLDLECLAHNRHCSLMRNAESTDSHLVHEDPRFSDPCANRTEQLDALVLAPLPRLVGHCRDFTMARSLHAIRPPRRSNDSATLLHARR